MDGYNNAPQARSEPLEDEHAAHRGATGHNGHKHDAAAPTGRITGFDVIAAQVAPLKMEPPVLITPPSSKKPVWTAASNAQNRPLRRTIEFKGETFEKIKDQKFEDRPLLDRIIGYGVAIHEGQMFGLANQLLGLATAIGYMGLVYSAAAMWLKRRREHVLGAPPPLRNPPAARRAGGRAWKA